MEAKKGPYLYGLIAEFNNEHEVVEAAKKVKSAGYTKTDAFSPFPMHAIDHALGIWDPRIKWFIFCGGLFGCIFGFSMQSYISAIDYPLNVGGRPMISWPQFIPVTFECTILGAALTAVFGMMALNGLPQLYHPVFSVPGFERASQDKFFLYIESKDPKFQLEATKKLLEELGPNAVSIVEDMRDDH